jgi:diguanylate cyclase (GGDEF)-like protein
VQVGQSIHTGSKFVIERRSSSGNSAIAVKYPTAAVPTPAVLARLQREYEIGSSLNLPSVRNVLGQCEWKGRPALELEYIPGETFKSFFRDAQHRNIETVLRLALSVTDSLARLHEVGFFHRDIAATNLLVREGGQEAVIIDLEFATHCDDVNDYFFTIEGQLPYISPEQTGRIDLRVDQRSDLYSLGIVLYEILTGELPFQAEDTAGWIHAHLARQPVPPLVVKSDVPQVISDIVMRLLAKVPANRYRTARGLYKDLARCLDELTKSGSIDCFSLGHDDHLGWLHFPPALYGRETEQQLLQTALDRAAAGKPGLQLISGFAGAGKTALVEQLSFPTAAVGGRFISGKFDQTMRALPYAAFAKAFAQLCRQLLAGTPEELESFRLRVLETLGINAGLLLEFVPVLEKVIGQQPLPEPVDTVESANRFTITLLSFFHCMVAQENPLVLFLDDIQWADAASLELLYMIVMRAVRKHFLIIAAYRDNELPADSPVMKQIDRLQREWPYVNHLSLGGLNLEQATALTAGALDISLNEAAPLAALIHPKTDGNPFFLRQVLETLVGEEVLGFDPKSNLWHWEAERIQALNISDNVIELMLRKIARLPEETRKALQVAACIGNTFSLDLLSAGIDVDRDTLRQLLASVADAGLVATLGTNARFTHDRIQQVVYQSLSLESAQQIHLRLGRQLLTHGHHGDNPLAAAQQMNLGLPLIESADEKQQLVSLNLEAGNMAKSTMAYVSAREFYSVGESLLSTSDPATAEQLFELRFHQAETTFYLGEVVSAVQQFRELLQHTTDTLARTRIYQMLIDIHTAEVNLTEALEAGKKALAELDVSIGKEVSLEHLQEGVDEIERIVTERGETITDWPEMQDKRDLAIAGLLTHLVSPAYIAASGEFPLISIEFARRALQAGLSRFSSFAFSVYGMLLAVVLNRYDSARKMGRLATEIAQRPDAAALRTRTNFTHAVFIMHWSEPLEATLPFLDEGWKIGVETGDLSFAAFCINHLHANSLFAGQSLAELEQSLAQFDDVIKIIRQEDGQYFFLMLKRTVEALRKPTEELPDLILSRDGVNSVDVWCESGNVTLRTIYQILRSLLAITLEKPAVALEEVERADTVIDGFSGTTWVPQHRFLHALALADAAHNGLIKTSVAVARIDKYRGQMKELAKHSPNNYRPKLLLIVAEINDLIGENRGVLLDAYDEAIEAATDAGRTFDHALACEYAANCWLRHEKPQLAGLYMQRALESYESWGAEAKVAQLRHDHSALLLPFGLHEGDSSATACSSIEGLKTVDIYSVLKAAQTVAGELVMDRMLARLIELVIETAGAECGFLLLKQNNEWSVVAAQQPGCTSVEVLQWCPLADYPEIAASVVQYAARTKETVNLDDAAKSTLFAADSSIAARHCKSLLCLPIINRGELAGILYLENNLASRAFTRTHTRLLQLLTTQAISSLEISRYYAKVQNLNRSLEAEIEERKRTESKLEFLANHDALTSLPNRRLFYDRAKHAIQRVHRKGGRVALLFLDLDQFKNINDTLSHQIGDRLLQQVAQRLAVLVREEDTLGRLGGDEYVLLVEGDFDLNDLSTIASKLLAIFQQPFHVEGHDLYPTGSLGISLYPDDASDADQLLQNADAAMYQAKHLGRNNFQFYSARLAEAAAERLTLEQDLRLAIDREEFELYFQPQVMLKTGHITGAEVLLRWNHPTRGLLLPGDFIPVAEESGNIIAIGEWVLRKACQCLEQWRSEGLEYSSLAVNVSGCQIGPHGGFTELVKQVLEESDIDPAHLELELTESVILQDTEFTLQSLQNLNACGFRLAIDDFGTGYSSLSYLHRLPVQRMKIDRSFVSGLPQAKDSAMIVKSILVMGRNLGKEIIAEGIETEEQRYFLQQSGCAEGQGYLFGKPMPRSAFEKLLRQGRI